MKNVQVSTVHFEMLKSSAKRRGIKPEALIEMLIQEEFNRKK